MTLCFRSIIQCILLCIALAPAWSMQIEWRRMTGQWAVETSPVVADIDKDGSDEILCVNQSGQLLLWNLDGTAIGEGQDGLVAQMPEGRWTTTPTVVDSAQKIRIVLCNVEGLVVGMDTDFKSLWQYQLGGETTWGRAIPAVGQDDSRTRLYFGDCSGSVTCLDFDGNKVWAKSLGQEKCGAPLQIFSSKSGSQSVLAAFGSTLYCLSPDGEIVWSTDLAGKIMTRPEILSLPDEEIIVCGAGAGSLFGINPEGDILWESAIGDEIDTSIAFFPRSNDSPLILCTGLWGNLNAIDIDGNHIWTHLYRAKGRGVPLVADINHDGNLEILVTTYHSYVFVFNENGDRVDQICLNALINSSPIPIVLSDSKGTDILVTTSTLLAYRLHGGIPTSPYGKTGEPANITLTPPQTDFISEQPSLLVNNPNGSLIIVNLSMTDQKGWKRTHASITARSAFEIPLQPYPENGNWSLQATAQDPQGQILAEKVWNIPPRQSAMPNSIPEGTLSAWSTPAYASFDQTRLFPYDNENLSGSEHNISIENVYQDEADQGAFIIASTLNEPIRARIVFQQPARQDKTPFG
ncbi:MAG: PQQ-binding-like beta-propeller repeat protein, partial [bacterium]